MSGKMGEWAFNVGVVIALVMGLASKWVPDTTEPFLMGLLVLMGLVSGFMNVTEKETKDFLLVGAVLLISAGTGSSALAAMGTVGAMMADTFRYLLVFIMPQTLVVALKAVHAMSKDA